MERVYKQIEYKVEEIHYDGNEISELQRILTEGGRAGWDLLKLTESRGAFVLIFKRTP